MKPEGNRGDPARNTNLQEGNESIATAGAWHNNSSDSPDPFVLYSSSKWRISIAHRNAYCCRIPFAAPVVSETIQNIVLQVVLYLWSIPATITARTADAMLRIEYDF
ncbi:hypothetical protein B5807_07556 [Epicoccum nigrum]|uniref:Uncharacterized protein n=1 Tax=Epicoccum nigrum TaxID=105696 RepID=A0A1Y2LUW0_EPING|nr:hypothetical protein B5807_07556 [Epicoccum nigrum]